MIKPPSSTEELMSRCDGLAGQSLAELADLAGLPMPKDLRKNKGWVGQLIEWHLGATAGSKPEQD
ncbi:MAG: DNA mismatch repair protein MutH, partial [Psychromonas sp.]